MLGGRRRRERTLRSSAERLQGCRLTAPAFVDYVPVRPQLGASMAAAALTSRGLRHPDQLRPQWAESGRAALGARATSRRCREDRPDHKMNDQLLCHAVAAGDQSRGALIPRSRTSGACRQCAITSTESSRRHQERWSSFRQRVDRDSRGGRREEGVGGSGAGTARGSAHNRGTCRMGNDPNTSVVDKFHRAHDVPNLFVVDGSNLVTGGTQPPHHDGPGARVQSG